MNAIETKEDLHRAFALSYDGRILILKLSNNCPISESLYKKLGDIVSSKKSLADQVYLLVVQDARSLSNEIALKFGVIHETPQVLIIENEDVVFYENHNNIDIDKAVELLHKPL
jgi:bacillithiol system protein YtxJ